VRRPIFIALAVAAVATAAGTAMMVRLSAVGDGPASASADPGPRIEIITVLEGATSHDRHLHIVGGLSGIAIPDTETYIWVTVEPSNGTPVGGSVESRDTKPVPRVRYVSAGTMRRGDGRWESDVQIMEGETRELVLHAQGGALCPTSPSAGCMVEEQAIVTDLATGSDSRHWELKSPSFVYRPAG
jgi:hypothetical protein